MTTRRDLIDDLSALLLDDAIATGQRIGNPTAYRSKIAENLELENTDAQLRAMLAAYAERAAREEHGQAKPSPRVDPIETAQSAYRRSLAAGADEAFAISFALDAACKANGELDLALEQRVRHAIGLPPAQSDVQIEAQIAARYQRIALAAIKHRGLAESVAELCGPNTAPPAGYTAAQLASIVRLLEQTAVMLGITLGPLPDADPSVLVDILTGATA